MSESFRLSFSGVFDLFPFFAFSSRINKAGVSSFVYLLLLSTGSKTAAKMAVARIKLLRNKRQVVVKQMRRDIALLLQSGQDATARIRVFLYFHYLRIFIFIIRVFSSMNASDMVIVG